MSDITAINDVTGMIEKYQQAPEKWIDFKHFYDEARRVIEGRVKQHVYFSVDADKALEELDKFYYKQLGNVNQNDEITDTDER